MTQAIMERLRHSLKVFIKIISFLGNGGLIMLLQYYDGLWIYNIDTICILWVSNKNTYLTESSNRILNVFNRKIFSSSFSHFGPDLTNWKYGDFNASEFPQKLPEIEIGEFLLLATCAFVLVQIVIKNHRLKRT